MLQIPPLLRFLRVFLSIPAQTRTVFSPLEQRVSNIVYKLERPTRTYARIQGTSWPR